MDGTERRGEILNDNEGEREYIVMCNFHTVLVGSSGNIESPCCLLLYYFFLSFTPALSPSSMMGFFFLCTVSAAHPHLQMTRREQQTRLVPYISISPHQLF